MTKIEAFTLVHSIELERGLDAARAVQLSPQEWIVQLMGETSGWGRTRSCIYVCWEMTDWRRVPADTKERVKGEGTYGQR